MLHLFRKFTTTIALLAICVCSNHCAVTAAFASTHTESNTRYSHCHGDEDSSNQPQKPRGNCKQKGCCQLMFLPSVDLSSGLPVDLPASAFLPLDLFTDGITSILEPLNLSQATGPPLLPHTVLISGLSSAPNAPPVKS